MWTVLIRGSESNGLEWSLPADTRDRAIQYAEWFFGKADLASNLKRPSDVVSAGDCILAKLSSGLIKAIQSGEIPEICPVPTDSDYFILQDYGVVSSSVSSTMGDRIS
jgi:hypothetical protein